MSNEFRQTAFNWQQEMTRRHGKWKWFFVFSLVSVLVAIGDKDICLYLVFIIGFSRQSLTVRALVQLVRFSFCETQFDVMLNAGTIG